MQRPDVRRKEAKGGAALATARQRASLTHTPASLPTLALALSALTLVLVQVLMPVLTLMPARK